MENNILLKGCKENELVNSAGYLGLLDKDELGRDDLTWDEVEPYIRILGVRTRDLYELGPNLSQNHHDLEGILFKLHEKLCQILHSTNPIEKIEFICTDIRDSSENLPKIQEKQQICLRACAENLTKISKKFQKFSLKQRDISSSKSEETNPNTLCLRLNNISTKVKLIQETIKNNLYNEHSLPALNMIKEELFSTYDEYNDIRSLLRDRILVYEHNPQLAKLASRYTQLAQRIQQKKADIASISTK